MGTEDERGGRVAVITGGASGIGFATARRLVGDGARVVLGDVDVDGLRRAEEELGSACVTAEVDVRREADVERLVAYAVEHFGAVDAAVGAAGVGGFGPLVDTAVDEWSRVVDTCLTGAFLTLKHAAGAMVRAGRPGVVVLVSSINARQPAIGMAPYCAAKAGVEQLVRTAGLELGPVGIRVCGVAPGLVDTPLTEFARTIPGLREEYLDNIPLGRIGTPDDVADAIAFLLSDQAAWVSAETLVVDGAETTRRYPDIAARLADAAE
ncbi:MAG TPA: SDR family NAD(P)-dependent oxidoreductase [Acidimicrobiales bacterium]|nr:SDR family NAD(P)-dependent oxidoreductase [Acidimicrobiales bacterium]